MNHAALDTLTRTHTAARTFAELLDGFALDYVPSLMRSDQQLLADVYDAAQIERGDPRRAFRRLAMVRP